MAAVYNYSDATDIGTLLSDGSDSGEDEVGLNSHSWFFYFLSITERSLTLMNESRENLSRRNITERVFQKNPEQSIGVLTHISSFCIFLKKCAR